MATLNIRQLDEEVVRKLKARAAEHNRSLESEARHILEQAVQEDMVRKAREFRALSLQLREQTRGTVQTPRKSLSGKTGTTATGTTFDALGGRCQRSDKVAG